ADAKLDWSASLACDGAHLEPNPAIASFSDIDGHQVNAGARRQPLGAFKLFSFSAKIDPVPTMLVQDHRQVITDFYGLTTSFMRSRPKPSVTALADEEGAQGLRRTPADTRGRTSSSSRPSTSSSPCTRYRPWAAGAGMRAAPA